MDIVTWLHLTSSCHPILSWFHTSQVTFQDKWLGTMGPSSDGPNMIHLCQLPGCPQLSCTFSISFRGQFEMALFFQINILVYGTGIPYSCSLILFLGCRTLKICGRTLLVARLHGIIQGFLFKTILDTGIRCSATSPVIPSNYPHILEMEVYTELWTSWRPSTRDDCGEIMWVSCVSWSRHGLCRMVINPTHGYNRHIKS